MKRWYPKSYSQKLLSIFFIFIYTSQALAQTPQPNASPSPQDVAPTGTANRGIFDHHSHRPCPDYLNEHSSIPASCRGSQVDSLCHAIKAIDDATMWAMLGGTAYTTAAVACGVACVAQYPPVLAVFVPACAALSAVGGLTEIGAGQALGQDNYSQFAKDGRRDLFKTTSGIGAAVGALQGLRFMQVLTSSATSGATTGANAGGQAGASTTSRVISCASFVVATTLATFKWVNMGMYENGAVTEERKIDPLASISQASCQPSSPTPNLPTASSDSTGSIGAAAGGLGNARATYHPTGSVTAPGITGNSLASAATADGGTGLGQTMGPALPNLANAVEQQLGATPQQIGDALASGQSPADIIGKLVPEANDAAHEIMEKRDEIANQAHISNDPNNLYANATSNRASVGSDMPALPDLSALFGKKEGANGPATNGNGASLVRFGRDEASTGQNGGGDIWHVGSKRSIFEIVSDRWSVITRRFMREDADAAAVARASGGSTAPPQNRQPAATSGGTRN